MLIVPHRRLWCEHCGSPHLEALDWLTPHRRVTRRLGASHRATGPYEALEASSIVAAAAGGAGAGLARHRVPGMDEFARHKGHRYATVVVEPLRRQ